MSADLATEAFAELRPRLFAIAYRLLGSVTEAEDVLQESWLAWARVDHESVVEPAAYLTTLVTRRSLDVLRSARVRRETYIGPWLPEPLLDGADQQAPAEDASDPVLLAESVRTAFLVVLESLSPAERVAFVLHDVFGYGYAELAVALGRSEDACRQLTSRARSHVAARRPRFDTDEQVVASAAERFLAASVGGDVAALVATLHPDVELISDGGGKARAARRIVVGSDRVARFFAGTLQPGAVTGAAFVTINGAPGVVVTGADGTRTAACIDIEDGLVRRVHLVRNPDKLRHVAV
ncbi:RNA polymerase sigma factor SigJ [Nitriliruptor alkaliphilus]|uniref:RNA polymerase sigma factor SigJ n=1 Tax=Nitriliruptor alkaliphilus TaxID=427918 RepID=UPI0006963332|nr:RNA polymerase sigma factor SigJ [Nitriliruptor alkaliphilus]